MGRNNIPLHRELMASATFAPPTAPPADLQAAHDGAAHMMSLLAEDTSINVEDAQALQNIYTELEQRRTLLNQARDYTLTYENAEGPNDNSDREEKERAYQFANFLASLDPNDEATNILFQGSKHIVAALGRVEHDTDLFGDVPMEKILDIYERIKAREQRLKSDGGPASLANARAYLSEATTLSDTVQMLITLDTKTVPVVVETLVEAGTPIEGTA
ncbi:hypothetical protein B0H17DRAFT_1097432 [Mycena rosella]|uniref:Uncharacterized protein n=1 Tax=Mycena rosella TaxID=1033263 RepID=A0AAD7CQH3_MYCRO|nr:hypothetical protein B0H17DRAFT_1097432 [Mycena rosella]